MSSLKDDQEQNASFKLPRFFPQINPDKDKSPQTHTDDTISSSKSLNWNSLSTTDELNDLLHVAIKIFYNFFIYTALRSVFDSFHRFKFVVHSQNYNTVLFLFHVYLLPIAVKVYSIYAVTVV